MYLTGYRTIPTIGWLFLLQVISAFVLAAAVLVSGSRLVAGAGAAFALATLGGYLLSLWVGLFGFTEVRTAAGISAGIIEVAAFARARRASAGPRRAPRARCPGRLGLAPAWAARLRNGVPGARWAVAAGIAEVA